MWRGAKCSLYFHNDHVVCLLTVSQDPVTLAAFRPQNMKNQPRRCRGKSLWMMASGTQLVFMAIFVPHKQSG